MWLLEEGELVFLSDTVPERPSIFYYRTSPMHIQAHKETQWVYEMNT